MGCQKGWCLGARPEGRPQRSGAEDKFRGRGLLGIEFGGGLQGSLCGRASGEGPRNRQSEWALGHGPRGRGLGLPGGGPLRAAYGRGPRGWGLEGRADSPASA